MNFSQPIRVEDVDSILLDRSIKTGIKYEFSEMESMISTLVQLLGITSEEKTYIDGLARASGDYPIDAEDMMKKLGIIKESDDSCNIGKSLYKANLIPQLKVRELAKKANPTAVGLAPNATLSLYINASCNILRVSVPKDGQIRHSFKYKLTIRAAHKVLMRAYNDDKFADYFSIQLQLIEKYKKYQSDYDSYLKDLAMQQKNETINRLEHKIEEQTELMKAQAEEARKRDEEARKQNEEQTKIIKQQSSQIAELLEYAQDTKTELGETRKDISNLHSDVINHHAQMTEAAQHSSVEVPDPSKRQYFAMTSYREVGDDSGKLYFTIYRSQLKNLRPKLLRNLVHTSTKGDREYTAHQLVVPPIYCPGSVNIGNLGAAKLNAFLVG